MFARVLTSSIYGISGEPTWAEVDAEGGLPAFNVVGLGSQSVREARERIRSAVENCGFEFPAKRITVNLTPANRKKDGSHYDLPIAVGLLLCSEAISLSQNHRGVLSGQTAFLGELSLDGRICPVEGVLPMATGLKRNGVTTVVVPEGNAAEALLVKDLTVIPARDLQQIADHLSGFDVIEPAKQSDRAYAEAVYSDFADIRGQEEAKRAAQLAAAGMHGLLMAGPPGVGKSMIGKRIAGLLPPLTYEEKLEVTEVYSVAGELKAGTSLISARPFRAPHHSISRAALVGGGTVPKPGEISLAHRGVLFLDELPEFASGTLDALRQPLEDGSVQINRVNFKIKYPARFMLVAAMNPCRCGYWGDPVRPCTCTQSDRQKYLGRISGPLLDRIDIHTVLSRIVYGDISPEGRACGSSTAQLKKGVDTAIAMQNERYKGLPVSYNSQLGAKLTEKYCVPDRAGRKLIEAAYKKWDLSARAYHRLLRLSRTAADTDGSSEIKEEHVLEALRYRFPEDRFR